MAKYKVLQSVAHSIGHSFTSFMNYADNDYVLGHILTHAHRSGKDTLLVNLISGSATPPELLEPPVNAAVQRYVERLPELVRSHKSDPALIRSAGLTLHFDLTRLRPHFKLPDIVEAPYPCEVVLTDDRGKEYCAYFSGWWFPEPPEPIIRERHPWWAFWRWLSSN